VFEPLDVAPTDTQFLAPPGAKQWRLDIMGTPSDPFEEGKLAASKGEPAASNPYPPGSEEHELWAEGYDYTTVADEDGEPKGDDNA
jgi:hypothetical protein